MIEAPTRTNGSPDDAERAARRASLAALLAAEGRLDRAYLFDPLERGGVAFRLAMVIARLPHDRLELVAIGERVAEGVEPTRDFVRRASFPAATLPDVLEELIDRLGTEGARYREVPLTGCGDGETDPLDRLVGLLEGGEA